MRNPIRTITFILAIFAANAVLAATYTDLAGPVPSPITLEWRDWYETLLAARINEIPTTRATTYYFAANGNDSTGNGSIATPYRTVAKANTLTGASGDVALLFRQGDEFPTAEGINITRNNITIGSYSTSSVYGPKPLIHCFINTIASGGASWTLDNDGSATAGDTYSASENTAVGWIREKGSPAGDHARLNPFRYFNTRAEVRASPWSWTWIDADDAIYVNCGDGVDPNTKVWEYSDAATAADDGCQVQGFSGCLIDGVRFDGFGAYSSGSQVASFGVRINGNMTGKTCLVRNVEAYYTGNHAIGAANDSGGLVTFVGCMAGYVNDTWGAGSSTYVAFASDTTGMEAILDSCVARFGILPYESDGNYDDAGGDIQLGWYTHNGGTGTISLYVQRNCRDTQETWPTNWTSTTGAFSGMNFPGTENDLSTYRVFIVDHLSEMPSGGGLVNFQPLTFSANCKYLYTYPSTNTDFLRTLSSPSGGVHVNSIISIIDRYVSSQRAIIGPSTSSTARIWHPTLAIRGWSAAPSNAFQGLALGAAGSTLSGTGVEIRNGIFQATGSKGLFNTYGNSAGGRVQNNAFYAATTSGTNGFDTTSGYQTIASPVDPLAIPPSNATYVGDGLALGVEYDHLWRRRPSTGPTLGAFEGDVDNEPTLQTIADRLGPWTGDTDKNSVYGALRSLANAKAGYDSPDLIKDDGDGGGSYDNTTDSEEALASSFATTFLRGIGAAENLSLIHI